MRNTIAEAAEQLRAAWPEAEIWWVPRATGKPVVIWCARRRDDGHVVAHADSPGELELALGLAADRAQR